MAYGVSASAKFSCSDCPHGLGQNTTYAGTVAPDTSFCLKNVDGREGSGRSFGVDQSAARSHEPLAPGATLGLLRSETLAFRLEAMI